MREVAILGAGALGGTLAHLLARRGVVSKIRLLDESGQVAAGTALDIMQASPLDQFTTVVSGSSDFAMMAGASLVVIADRVDAGEWQGDDALLLLRSVARLAGSSVVLCAGASQRELVERGVREVQLRRTRLFGSAPEALAGAIRAIVALEANTSPRDVAIGVVGVPPDRAVVLWEDATISGLRATSLLDEPTRRRVAARVVALWPPGPYSLAAAATEAATALLGRSHRTLSCFVAPDDSGGRRARAVAWPVRLDAAGVTTLPMPGLSTSAQVALDTAMLL